MKKIITMLPKSRGCPPKIHCNLAGLQNNPSLTPIPSVTSFLEVVTLSVREMMKNWSRDLGSHTNCTKKNEASEAEDSGEEMDMQRVIGMSLMSRIFLRDWLRWRCRMQKNSLKILARPKTRGNNMKTPFLSSFCLSNFRTVIRFPPKNLVPEILKLLTLVVRNCRCSNVTGTIIYFYFVSYQAEAGKKYWNVQLMLISEFVDIYLPIALTQLRLKSLWCPLWCAHYFLIRPFPN